MISSMREFRRRQQAERERAAGEDVAAGELGHLVVGRRVGQQLVLQLADGREIWIALHAAGNTCRLGVRAPRDVRIVRAEVHPQERPAA